MIEIINVADLIDPNDEKGRSYREINHSKIHGIAIDSLVEIESGLRLHVVGLTRDCDGTPLYNLGYDGMILCRGYGEDSLRVIEE